MSMTWPFHGRSLDSDALVTGGRAAGPSRWTWTRRITLGTCVAVVLTTAGPCGLASAAGSPSGAFRRAADFPAASVQPITAAGPAARDERGTPAPAPGEGPARPGAGDPGDPPSGDPPEGGPPEGGPPEGGPGRPHDPPPADQTAPPGTAPPGTAPPGTAESGAAIPGAVNPDTAAQDAGVPGRRTPGDTTQGRAVPGQDGPAPASDGTRAEPGAAAQDGTGLEEAAARLRAARGPREGDTGWRAAQKAWEKAWDKRRRRDMLKAKARRAACPPTSIICIENSLPGSPPSEWAIPGAGDSNIQGYATQMSVNVGETALFKIDTSATSYRLDIYRYGYYGGLGARLITTVNPTATLPQTQPACLTDPSVGLVDCGNWAVSASWDVPPTAVSGVYFAKLVRTDGTPGASHITFVVRDDGRHSELLFKTSDTAWQAYNAYGGNSLYTGSPAGRAYKVSYNRPFTTACCSCCLGGNETWFSLAEYPMVRWLEANAYDVSYFSSVDTAARGAELLEHKVFLSVGHDEYWSEDMRTNVENARDSGVNLTFFSGNEVFWKTRWEPSIDGGATPFRTLVCYKETHANQKIDPSPQWTGSWRDPRFSPPSNGGRPENGLTGTLFMVNGVVNDAIVVPADFSSMRIWRNTAVANLQPGQVVTFPAGTLGSEWDVVPDNGFEPPGPVKYSRTTIATPNKYLLDFGSNFGAGVATHNLLLYKVASGALVFGAGTIQWSWGLDATHSKPGTPTDITMQQATVNLFADMNCQPASLQPGLVPATPSTDTAPPTSTIDSPSTGASVESGIPVTVQGTAADTGGGVVAGVEISFDGVRWFQATGRTDWQFSWLPSGSQQSVTIRVRAVDDIGNLQVLPTTVTVTVTTQCPCSIWPPTTVPATLNSTDTKSVELGVKFRATAAGYINGIRFYKGSLNTGTHTGSLWTSSGQLLATATFTNETDSGWQQVNFSVPVPVDINTTYVASYFAPNGRYSYNLAYFTTDVVSGPLTALANNVDGGNGVYRYGTSSSFPTSTYQASNYWVDVVFTPMDSLWTNGTTPANPANPDTTPVTTGVKFQASTTGEIRGIRFYKGVQNTGTHIGSLWTTDGQLLASATYTNETASGWQQVNFATPVQVKAGTTYIASTYVASGHFPYNLQYFTTQYSNPPLTALADGAEGGNGVYAYNAVNTFPQNTFQSANYWVDVVFAASQSLWNNAATPDIVSHPDSDPVVLGVKFQATANGTIRGIRFYKGPQNTGTHVGSLWTTGGQLLASVTFTDETESGWQQAYFATPVPVTAGTTYIASYNTTAGHFSYTLQYFTGQYTNFPLLAPASDASGGNGVYIYSPVNTFPQYTYQAANYWVDVLYDQGNVGGAPRVTGPPGARRPGPRVPETRVAGPSGAGTRRPEAGVPAPRVAEVRAAGPSGARRPEPPA
ncbi:DUF4082 domain-containing protein [Sphaerisporangium rhizosphaerae]|uniref:DUF4082 domain-containing protein n=1 Tax=Sphaerisporangium rhizosphaerae TaxID=2269375 RepID=A0ABW2NYR7_9ACTN